MLRLPRVLLASVAFVVLCFGFTTVARADTIALDAIDSGWYSQNGFHIASIENYIVGRCNTCGQLAELRNFFVFDLSLVAPGSVTSATLRLFNAPGGYSSPDPSEVYTVFDIITPVAILRASHSNPEGLSIFSDLGSGAVYGSVTVTPASSGTIVTFDLNAAAIAALNSADGGLFAVGGALTTLGTAPNEYVFGNTGAPGHIRQLVLEATPIPEPATILLLGTGLAGVGAAVRRRHKARHSENV